MNNQWSDDGVGCAVLLAFLAGFFLCAWWYGIL